MKKTCFIYIRTAIDSKDSTQLRIQLRACLKLAHDRGFQVKAVITDFGSGYKINKNLSTLTESYIGDTKTLIAFSSDRISRNYNLYADTVQQLRKIGIRVEFVNKSHFMQDLII